MKKILIILGLVSLALLASCSKKDKEVVVNTLTEDTQVAVEVETEATPEDTDASDDSSTESEAPVEAEDSSEAEEAQEVIEEVSEEAPVTLAGTYADYDSSLVGKTENTVLFFHASWCGKCRTADAAISGESIPDGLTVLKVDFDSAGELRQKYGITSQHTLVQIDADGNEIAKWSGSKNIADIEAKLQ